MKGWHQHAMEHAMGLRLLVWLLLFLPIAALSSGCTRHLGPDEWPIHQRVLLSNEDGELQVVELLHPDGMAPGVTVQTLGSDGSPGETRALSPQEAGRVAADVRGGALLEAAALSPQEAGRVAVDVRGGALLEVAPLSPQEAGRIAVDVRGGALLGAAPQPIRWSEELVMSGPSKSRRSLGTRVVEDPRYGSRRVVEFRGEGLSIAMLLLPTQAAASFAALEGDSAWVAWEIGGGATRLRDVRRIDLLQAEADIQLQVAERFLAEDDEAAAWRALDLAETLKPADAEVAYAKARLAALTGAAIDDLLPWLERAIAADPPLYRMRARTLPAFAPWRDDPRFRSLVAPAPLQGTQRIKASRPAPPSATPDH